MKEFKFLQTDFYQISMGFAYIINGLNKQKTGFEGFVRHIKNAVNPNHNFYIFDGETEIKEYIETIKLELKDPELLETFITLIEPKITAPNKDELIALFRENWKTIDTDFEYSVIPNGTMVFPLTPVFQYNGDKFIGQMIETYVTNTYNGKTGLATLKYLRDNGYETFINDEEFNFLDGLMNGELNALTTYARILDDTAKDFRYATDKILLEAAFRRAPSFLTAKMASESALLNGWDGTSNTSIVLNGRFPMNKINGTMAHSWVMSFPTEEEAFIAWDRIFPGTTFLIDTYDVVNAAKLIKRLILEGKITKPKDLRIDSDPIEEYAFEVRKIFDEMGIYLSGDMEPEKFKHFEFLGVPYTKAMAGTKYCYSSMIVEKLNCGFVYKIVEYTNSNGEVIRPEKKANGKKNYSGLKHIKFIEETNTLEVYMGDKCIGFDPNITKTNINTTVNFIEL